MRKTVLSLGAAAATAAAATALALAPAAPTTSPDSREPRPAKTFVDDSRDGSGYYFEDIALTPANDKEAHVPIWFTLSIGGAEAAGFFQESL
ncbi:MAG TPA: hypothetical protein VKB57_13015 [Acidimicrobiales bacterium]|nr:hypothetical protein [Acidimicrobiales bacterium]